MKKQFIFLFAGSLLTLGACNNAPQATTSQAQVDSMANVKAAELQAQMAAKNDSMIQAVSKAKADSEMAAAKESEHSKEHSGGHKEHTKTTEAAPAPVKTGGSGLQAHSDQVKANPGASPDNKPKGGSGLQSHADQNRK